jgi:hypothetical protein
MLHMPETKEPKLPKITDLSLYLTRVGILCTDFFFHLFILLLAGDKGSHLNNKTIIRAFNWFPVFFNTYLKLCLERGKMLFFFYCGFMDNIQISLDFLFDGFSLFYINENNKQYCTL